MIERRLEVHFRTAEGLKVDVAPHFPGCGWLDECEGDVFYQGRLVEIKAGERGFRGTDIRQLLIYCALNQAAQKYDISRVCLLNPRVGVELDVQLEQLCRDIAGRSALDVLAEIVQFVSEPADRYDRA
jgi:hypothetical protein